MTKITEYLRLNHWLLQLSRVDLSKQSIIIVSSCFFDIHTNAFPDSYLHYDKKRKRFLLEKSLHPNFGSCNCIFILGCDLNEEWLENEFSLQSWTDSNCSSVRLTETILSISTFSWPFQVTELNFSSSITISNNSWNIQTNFGEKSIVPLSCKMSLQIKCWDGMNWNTKNINKCWVLPFAFSILNFQLVYLLFPIKLNG